MFPNTLNMFQFVLVLVTSQWKLIFHWGIYYDFNLEQTLENRRRGVSFRHWFQLIASSWTRSFTPLFWVLLSLNWLNACDCWNYLNKKPLFRPFFGASRETTYILKGSNQRNERWEQASQKNHSNPLCLLFTELKWIILWTILFASL